MKRIIFLCALMPIAANAMSNQQVKVSERFATNLGKVNRDGGKLYFFCNGVFGAMAEKKAEEKPSDILSFLANGEGNINEATQCEYKPATWYLSTLVKRLFGKLDLAFLSKLKCFENDQQKTWQWFDGHFKEEGLSKPLTELKRQALSIEQTMMEHPERRKDGDPFEMAAALNNIAADLQTYAQDLGLTGPENPCPIQ